MKKVGEPYTGEKTYSQLLYLVDICVNEDFAGFNEVKKFTGVCKTHLQQLLKFTTCSSRPSVSTGMIFH